MSSMSDSSSPSPSSRNKVIMLFDEARYQVVLHSRASGKLVEILDNRETPIEVSHGKRSFVQSHNHPTDTAPYQTVLRSRASRKLVEMPGNKETPVEVL